MVLTFKDLEKIVDDDYNRFEGEGLMWFQLVWTFAEKNGFNSFSTCADKLRAYSFIYGMCLIYQEFTAKLLDYEECSIPELCIDYKVLTDSSYYDEELFAEVQDESGDWGYDLIRSYAKGIITAEENMLTAFDVLQKELGISKTFASLYYCLNYSQFSLEEWETDEFYYGDIDDKEELEEEIENNQDYEQRKIYASYEGVDEIYDEILNNIDTSKIEAFGWLSNYLN